MKSPDMIIQNKYLEPSNTISGPTLELESVFYMSHLQDMVLATIF